jgi:hypothetical protein
MLEDECCRRGLKTGLHADHVLSRGQEASVNHGVRVR